MAAFVFFFFLV